MSTGKIEGGAFGGAEDLYREVILEHFKMPKNRGILPNATSKADGMNPLCGDQISMTLRVDGDKLSDIRFDGHGCAISQSAASMLTQLVKGKKLGDVKELAQAFKFMFGVKDEAQTPPTISTEKLGDLVALEGVKKYPVRIKCAILSANTLLQGLTPSQESKGV